MLPKIRIVILFMMTLLICFLGLNLKNTYKCNSDLKSELQSSNESLKEIKRLSLKNKSDKMKLQELKEKLEHIITVEKFLNFNISDREKYNKKLLKENGNLSLEIELLKSKNRPMPYLYFDSVLEDELINTIIDHFEAKRTQDKDAYISTISSSNREYLMHFFYSEPEYLTRISYPYNRHEGEDIDWANSSFFTLVSTDLSGERNYWIGVNNKKGRWLIHDYD